MIAVPRMSATATTVTAINRAMRTDELVGFLYAYQYKIVISISIVKEAKQTGDSLVVQK